MSVRPAMCPACRTPMDPALPEAGITTHPMCESPGQWRMDRPVPSCGDCRAPVLWAVTERGLRMPLDPQALDNGNLACRVTVGVRRVRYLRKGDEPGEGETRRRAHAVSCPARRERSKT